MANKIGRPMGVKVEIDLGSKSREDLIITALEGGSNYWYYLSDEATAIINERCDDTSEPLSVKMWQAIENGATIEIHDVEDEETKLGEINLESINRGEQLLVEKQPLVFYRIKDENYDAGDADIWFQFCVLWEVVYG